MGLLGYEEFVRPRRRRRGMGEWTAVRKDPDNRWVNEYGVTASQYQAQYGSTGYQASGNVPGDVGVPGPDLVMGVDYPAISPDQEMTARASSYTQAISPAPAPSQRLIPWVSSSDAPAQTPGQWTAVRKDPDGRWVNEYGVTASQYQAQYGSGVAPSSLQSALTSAASKSCPPGWYINAEGTCTYGSKPSSLQSALTSVASKSCPPGWYINAEGTCTYAQVQGPAPVVSKPEGLAAALARAGITPTPPTPGVTVTRTPQIAAQQPFAAALQAALQPRVALSQKQDPLSYLQQKTSGFVDKYGRTIAYGAGALGGLYVLVQVVKTFAPGTPPPVVKSNPRRRRRA